MFTELAQDQLFDENIAEFEYDIDSARLRAIALKYRNKSWERF
jgi:hypothetical protein